MHTTLIAARLIGFVFLTLLFAALGATPVGASIQWREAAKEFSLGAASNAAKETVRYEEAIVEVPEKSTAENDKKGKQLSLYLMRFRSSTAAGGVPTIFLHGGPGGSASGSLSSVEFRQFFAQLSSASDLILFDQRGAGRSQPSLIPARNTAFSETTFVSRSSFLRYLEDISRQVQDGLRSDGYDPQAYAVADSVGDIEQIRSMLGAARVNLVAISYGTQLAQAYARTHPDRVGRMVLISSRSMESSRKLPMEADEFLQRMDALVMQDAAIKLDGGLLRTLDRVLAKLDAKPVQVRWDAVAGTPMKLSVGGFALRFIIAKFYLNDPDSFRFLPRLLYEIDRDLEPESLFFALRQMSRSQHSLTRLATDAASGVSEERARRIFAEEGKSRLANAVNFPFPEIASAWKMPDSGSSFRAAVMSKIPALILVGEWDGITPPKQSQEIAKGFDLSKLIVVENAGHTSLLRAAGLAAAISGYLGGKIPDSKFGLPTPKFVALEKATAMGK